MVKSNKIYSAQSYLEKVTGKCYVVNSDNDIEFIETVLRLNGLDNLWNFPLEEIDHIVENKLDVILVDCCVWDDVRNEFEHEFRWFEVPNEV